MDVSQWCPLRKRDRRIGLRLGVRIKGALLEALAGIGTVLRAEGA